MQVAKWLLDPVCRGIFASSTRSLSMKSCFGAIHEAEQKHRSVIWGQMRTKKCKHMIDVIF